MPGRSPQDKNLSLQDLHALIDKNAKLLLNNGVIARGLILSLYCPLCMKPGAEISLRTGAWWHKCDRSTTDYTYGSLFADPAHIDDALMDLSSASTEGRARMLVHIAELHKERKARKKAKKAAAACICEVKPEDERFLNILSSCPQHSPRTRTL